MGETQKKSSIVIRGLNSVIVVLLRKFGLNLKGAEVLEVRGRSSGEIRSVPVNPVMVGSEQYLMSPRGETSWVKNIRVSCEGALRHGRSSRTFRVEEVPDEEKVPILRTYLDRWHWQVGKIMDIGKDADDAALQKIAPKHPVFRIVPAPSRNVSP